MVNSASQALAEFKVQRLGGLLTGTSSTVDSPTASSTSLSDTASQRLARLAPKKSTTAFMDQIRKQGQERHQLAMQGFQQKQSARQAVTGYGLPSGGKPQTGGPRGGYGLTVPAANAFGQLNQAYTKQFGTGLVVNSGGRTRQEQAQLYALYKQGKGNLAAPPGQSLHESGIAADFGGPLYGTTSTKQHAWMRQNAATYGWYWVGQRYGEPHHWEYHPEWSNR